ncbi:MAG: hypothetical protein OXG72_17215 [Acidobacteria bacterium]|nr:hypothetical protein [Acidobacteriota bacterium]
MGREELTLSTTGGHLWDRVHKAIADALANLHGGPYRFRLGGGTTLAARWEHRDSFDLDLAVSRDVPLRDLAEPGNRFRQTMEDRGGTATYHERQWIIEFDAGEVDLVQLSPIPPGAEREALVNGHPAMVLDSSQILHGKLERADDALVRDVFDLIKANERDPKALATAVNCRSRYDTEVTALTLEHADATLERDARTQLVGAGEIDDPATLGTQAGATLRGAVYRHVAIWTEGEQALIECRTASDAIYRTAVAPGEIDRTLDESGVGHYLGASAFGASRIREALHDACRTGVGHQKVWESGTAPPAATDRRPGRTQDPDR